MFFLIHEFSSTDFCIANTFVNQEPICGLDSYKNCCMPHNPAFLTKFTSYIIMARTAQWRQNHKNSNTVYLLRNFLQRVREKDSVCGVSVENMSESGSFDPPPPDQSVNSLLLLRANKADHYYY